MIEIFGAAVIVGGLIWATYNWLTERPEDAYEIYRRHVGHSLLLGLEILVAADILRTVALELSLRSLATLGILILIRTFLAWSLEVEVDGRWPWQSDNS